MIVKVGDGYLELNDSIEVEKKVKLFEDVSTTEGDFSYNFTIPKTKHNLDLIRIFTINDSDKRWNYKIPATIFSEAGVPIHIGFIRIQRGSDKFYNASFFSGNTNWIDILDFNLLDIDWSDFDKDSFLYFTETSGIVTPLTDRGGYLDQRQSAMFAFEDFQPYIYVKDVVNRALTISGLKITGDLLNLPEYQQLITSTGVNKYLQKEVDKRKVYVAGIL